MFVFSRARQRKNCATGERRPLHRASRPWWRAISANSCPSNTTPIWRRPRGIRRSASFWMLARR